MQIAARLKTQYDAKKKEESEKKFVETTAEGDKCYASCMQGRETSKFGAEICASGDPGCCRMYCVNSKCPLPKDYTNKSNPTGGTNTPSGGGGGGGDSGGGGGTGGTTGGTTGATGGTGGTSGTTGGAGGGGGGGNSSAATLTCPDGKPAQAVSFTALGITTCPSGGMCFKINNQDFMMQCAGQCKSGQYGWNGVQIVANGMPSPQSITQLVCTTGQQDKSFTINELRTSLNALSNNIVPLPIPDDASISSKTENATALCKALGYPYLKSVTGASSGDAICKTSASACPANGCALNNDAGVNFCASKGQTCVSTNTLPCVQCTGGAASSAASQGACPANGCALNNNGGNIYCQSQGLVCESISQLPCARCVSPTSSVASVAQSSSRQSSLAFSSVPSSVRTSSSSVRTSSSSSRSSVPSSRTSQGSSVSITYVYCLPGTLCPGGILCPDAGYCPPPPASSAASVGMCLPGTLCSNGAACTQDGRCPDLVEVIQPQSRSSQAFLSLLVCGNGRLDAGEECDDGNMSNTDTCSTSCRVQSASVIVFNPDRPGFNPLFCGNGELNTAEQCDLGAQNSDLPNASCRTDCTLSRCGDRIVDGVRGEQCDDGNSADGDGCSATCRIEQFAGQPQQVLPGSLVELPFVPGQQTYVPTKPQGGPIGDTGPETVAIMAAGASAGYTWIKMRRKPKF